MAAKHTAIAGGACLVLFTGVSMTVRFCFRASMHADAIELVPHACDNAVGKPISSDLASALAGTSTENLGPHESTWLSCMAEQRSNCGVGPSFKVSHGVFSALPKRYWVDVEVDRGVVNVCKISPAPGW